MFDTNLIFPKTWLEMDMSGATALADTIAKIQDDLLSTGLISTFWTMATKTSRALQKSTWKTKSGTTTASSTTNTDLVLSLITFSEQDLNFLIVQLT